MSFDLSDYEPVENRIRAFWESHPNGRILPDKPTLVLREDGKYQWECWTHVFIDKEDSMPTVRGFASEIEGSSPVNRTNASENCETSSIGRALANLGFATKGKRPSREEMAKVQRAQQFVKVEKKPINDNVWSSLIQSMTIVKTLENLQQVAGVAGEYELSEVQRNELLSIYTQKKAELSTPVAQDVVPMTKKEEVVSDIEEEDLVETPN
jgi:hypothetical protein